MRGQGDYPMGAANDPDAPWNQVDEAEPRKVTCEQCGGTGNIYFAYNFVTDTDWEVPEKEWNDLPEDEDTALAKHQHVIRGAIELCDKCFGDGELNEDDAW